MSGAHLGLSKSSLLSVLAFLLIATARCSSNDDGDGDGHAGRGDGRAGQTSAADAGAPSGEGTGGTPGVGGSVGGELSSDAGRSSVESSSGGVPGGETSRAGAGGDGEGERAAGAGGEGGAASSLVQVPDAQFTSGEPPETNDPSELPSILGLSGASATTNGGTTTLRIELDGKPATPTFVVVIEGDEGYFIATATDTNGDGIYEIEIHIDKDLDLSTMVVRVAPIDAEGNVGAYQTLEYVIVRSGVGAVKVTLSFNQDADLDLHVVEPSGFEIFFDELKSQSPSGGRLDLDSNASCIIDGKNTENVFWPDDTAPAGMYSVSVVNFDMCEVTEPVSYTVTVYNGPGVETFRGTFEAGAADEPRLITTFVH